MRRLAACVLDALLVGLATVPLALAAGWAGLVTGALAAFAYFGALEGGRSGQTLGKRALRIRVVDRGSGGHLGRRRAALRHAGRLVSALPCFLGYAWMLWDPERRTWHDRLADAAVVPASGPAPPRAAPGADGRAEPAQSMARR